MRKPPDAITLQLMKLLALCAILWAGFRYLWSLNNKESIFFALLCGSVCIAFLELYRRTEKAEDFVPYRVSISIEEPHDLLFNYNLLKSEEDWKRLCEKAKDTSIFNRGLNFTVLSLSKDGLPHLIWWDDHKIFLAGMPSFEEEIQGLEFPCEDRIRRGFENGVWSPSLYFGFRHGKGRGYNLALRVRSDWWEKNKAQNKVETDGDYLTGSVYLLLGALPYGEIGLDYEARGQARKVELEKSGWTLNDYQDPEISEFSRIEVRNEYFSVSQHFCETD
jgi:hypothetical protein